MPKFCMKWEEKTYRMAVVEAESESEAIEKVKQGEVIEGTQDSEPGPIIPKSVKVNRVLTKCRYPQSGDGIVFDSGAHF